MFGFDFGFNFLKGMAITAKHFFATYVQDIKTMGKWDPPSANLETGIPAEITGYITTQYPEQRLPVPERFRYNPMLIYEQETGDIRCTSCGICAKVCPPQCIWIVQAKDTAGKTIPQCQEFYIDTSICMQCGFCAEYCPFDAIKMNHDYEISSYERHESWVLDMQELLVSTRYYAATHPTAWEREEAERAAKEAEKSSVER
ncbi:NADH-quinone oxidoreductase subunit I [Ardenticatena maritima]|uniref:NADH-quinone oxidoreductase subunit I n=1 Tax=Ardenticatena maritima TaxID=872965 RepID=A0A0N0RFI3_9CHLR|nr:4Fe-4S binding protein [Ardenticatena maritima]GAP62227.1 NADH-quinone oxidoreductase subunit I [Ardenticatena maritima]